MSTAPLAPAAGGSPDGPADDDAPTSDPGDGSPAGAGGSVWSGLRPLVLRLHFYAGVLVAPFLLVAAVTGLLYAGSFQAEKIIYDHELSVPVGDRELPISQQVAAARKAHPEGEISAV
ncbi:PepSY domain-containing protein, partial [Streptomyces sp. MCAF7]